MGLHKGIIAAAAGQGGGAPLPQSGDITATDPLGLNIGQDILWTVGNIPPQGDKRHNPMHGLKTGGDPTESPSTDYWSGVHSQLATRMGGGLDQAHVALGWGDIEVGVSIFDWTEPDRIQSDAAAGGYHYSFQAQYKAFTGRGQPENIIPADLRTTANYTFFNTGYVSHVWQDNVMDRYIIFMQAIFARYDDDDNFEGAAATESAPSLGQADEFPPGYSIGLMSASLRRMYAEVGASAVLSNFWPMINSLGTELGALMEECYQLRIGCGGPDARAVPGFNVFQGPAFHSQAVRDYRGELSRILVASFSSYDDGSTEADIINLTQLHQTTHMMWVVGAGGATETSIKNAIAANPGLHNACPLRYLSCFIS